MESIVNLHIHLHSLTPEPPTLLGAIPELIPSTISYTRDTSTTTKRFELIVDGQIVVDHKTGLMWPTYESEQSFDFAGAEKFAGELRLGGFCDWILPTLEQRQSIVDYTRFKPALFAPLQSRHDSWEWTSSGCAWSKDEAGAFRAFWQVHADHGYVYYGFRYSDAVARPCRLVAPAGQ
jgi:hypothetical protein